MVISARAFIIICIILSLDRWADGGAKNFWIQVLILVPLCRPIPAANLRILFLILGISTIYFFNFYWTVTDSIFDIPSANAAATNQFVVISAGIAARLLALGQFGCEFQFVDAIFELK